MAAAVEGGSAVPAVVLLLSYIDDVVALAAVGATVLLALGDDVAILSGYRRDETEGECLWNRREMAIRV